MSMYQVSLLMDSTYYVHYRGEHDNLFQGSLADCLAWITLEREGQLAR